jgi:ribosomal protein S18 acetylase RimI-like enzyme
MIRFQTATINDSNKLAQLVNSAYRGDHSKKGWTTEADLLDGQRTDAESLSASIETPMNQFELVFEGRSEKLLGSVHLIQELPETLYFGMLTVDPTLQGQGFGKILLKHAEDVARGYGFKKLRCTVIPTRKELIDFYKRRGFKETGKFEEFPVDEKFGIPKVDGLRLQEFIKELI